MRISDWSSDVCSSDLNCKYVKLTLKRMRKTLIGPRLRQLRREHRQTQAEMAATLGVSTAYVNLLENNQRSLSVQMLMALSDAYGVDWRDLLKDEASTRLADLRNAMKDPIRSEEHTSELQSLMG